MSSHHEWGHASDALFTLDNREAAITELRPDDESDVTGPFVLGLFNGNGDGLALQGTRREILNYLQLAVAYVDRETDPRLELDQALKRLNALRHEIAGAGEDGNYSTCARRTARLEEQETLALDDVAAAAQAVTHDIYPH